MSNKAQDYFMTPPWLDREVDLALQPIVSEQVEKMSERLKCKHPVALKEITQLPCKKTFNKFILDCAKKGMFVKVWEFEKMIEDMVGTKTTDEIATHILELNKFSCCIADNPDLETLQARAKDPTLLILDDMLTIGWRTDASIHESKLPTCLHEINESDEKGVSKIADQCEEWIKGAQQFAGIKASGNRKAHDMYDPQKPNIVSTVDSVRILLTNKEAKSRYLKDSERYGYAYKMAVMVHQNVQKGRSVIRGTSFIPSPVLLRFKPETEHLNNDLYKEVEEQRKVRVKNQRQDIAML
jgi:hypothetical protein